MKDVLIVEDLPQERERLMASLAKAGYAVSGCSSAQEAQARVAEEQHRLCILDIGLNDVSGSHLFHWLRSVHESMFVLIFTGNPSVHLKNRFISEGAIDYIVKGSAQAHSDRILARVQEILGEGMTKQAETLPLASFLSRFVRPEAHPLFTDEGGSFPPCAKCGGQEYVVSFAEESQAPPEIIGVVKCAVCGARMEDQMVG